MSKKVLDIPQMQHLKELGVYTRTASLCWVCLLSEPYLSFYDKEYPQEDTKVIPSFTLQDILDLLPKEIHGELICNLRIDFEYNTILYGYDMGYRLVEFNFKGCCDIIDAAYKMLCWVIENGYLKVKQDEGI